MIHRSMIHLIYLRYVYINYPTYFKYDPQKNFENTKTSICIEYLLLFLAKK